MANTRLLMLGADREDEQAEGPAVIQIHSVTVTWQGLTGGE